MNEVLNNIITRRSVKKYKPDMVSDELIEQIVRAGTFAPTGMNKQSPIILAVTNKQMRDKLSDMNRRVGGWGEGMDPFYGAPVVLVVLANREYPTAVYDGSIVMENLMLAAHSLGVDSCWIHRAKEEFDSEEGKEILRSLGIKGEYEGVGHCILGYAEDGQPEAKDRKPDWVYYVK